MLPPGRAIGSFLLAFSFLTIEGPAATGAVPAHGGGGSAPRIVQELRLVAPPSEEARVRLLAEGLDPAQGTLRLELPEQVGFARLPDPRFAAEPRAFSGERELALRRPAPFVLEVETEGRETLTVEWSVALTHRRAQEVVEARDEFEFPYVAEDHALLVAGCVLARAANADDALQLVRIIAPEGWAVHAPWPEREPGLYEPGEGLTNDLVALGAWEGRLFAFEGSWGRLELSVLVAPGQEGLLGAVATPIERLLRAQLELFGRTPFERYLFVFGRSGFTGFGGSPKHSSMTLAVGGELREVAGRYVPHLVAHEFFHTFALHAELPDELRWFNEGVTDWYAYLTSARTGLSGWDELAGALAGKLDGLERNAARGKRSLVEAGGPGFFEGGDDYRLVYDGGLVVGAWLDRALRARGATLDALVRDFLDPARWAGEGARPSLQAFYALLAERGGDELAAELSRLVEEPFAPDLDELLPPQERGAAGLEALLR